MELDPNVIIDELGGTTKLAADCELDVSAISQWRKRGIPRRCHATYYATPRS